MESGRIENNLLKLKVKNHIKPLALCNYFTTLLT